MIHEPRGGAYVKGEVGKLDMAASDAAVSTFGFGNDTDGMSNVIKNSAAGDRLRGVTAVVAGDAVADDAVGTFHMSGRVQVLVDNENVIAAGAALMMPSGATFNGRLVPYVAAAGAKCCGILQEATDGAGAANSSILRWVLFDGDAGF